MVGNRIPKNFFIVSGSGESDLTIHAGSYHLALRDAGIEMCNIMTYSSILPKIAEKIERPKKLVHGSVMECILSVCHVEKGEFGTSGIIYGWLYEKNTKQKYGGLVCEIAGKFNQTDLEKRLHSSIEELYSNGYSEEYDLVERTILTKEVRPKKQYGTALVGLCFVSYIYPMSI